MKFAFLRFCSCNKRFVTVTVYTKLDIFIVDESAIYAGSSAIMFVTFNFLQLVPCFFLGGKKRHLIIRPAVVAPFSSGLIRWLYFIIICKFCAICCTNRLCVIIRVFIIRNIENFLFSFISWTGSSSGTCIVISNFGLSVKKFTNFVVRLTLKNIEIHSTKPIW